MNKHKTLLSTAIFLAATFTMNATLADSHGTEASDSSNSETSGSQQREMDDIIALVNAKFKVKDALEVTSRTYPDSGLLEVEIEKEGTQLYYKVTLLLADGSTLELYVNAVDGLIVPETDLANHDSDDSGDDSNDDSNDDSRDDSDDDSNDDSSDDSNDDSSDDSDDDSSDDSKSDVVS